MIHESGMFRLGPTANWCSFLPKQKKNTDRRFSCLVCSVMCASKKAKWATKLLNYIVDLTKKLREILHVLKKRADKQIYEEQILDATQTWSKTGKIGVKKIQETVFSFLSFWRVWLCTNPNLSYCTPRAETSTWKLWTASQTPKKLCY